jgi:hypothetical protein
MPHTRSGLVALILTLTVATTACGRTAHRSQPELEDGSGVASDAGHMVIEREVLGRSDVPVLDILRYRVPGMKVSPTDDCPEVTLRGKSTLVTSSNPAIYVDGERAANTCILTMLSTFHLERVEVYPSGIPPAGYLTNPYGVILIFSLTGPE